MKYVGHSAALPKGTPDELRGLFDAEEVRRLVDFEDGGPLSARLIKACAGPPSKARVVRHR